MTAFEERLRAHLETERASVPPLRSVASDRAASTRFGGLGGWMLGAAVVVLLMVTVVAAL